MHTFRIHKMHVQEERQEASSSEPEEMSTRRRSAGRDFNRKVPGLHTSTSMGQLWRKLRECEPDSLLCPEGQGNNT